MRPKLLILDFDGSVTILKSEAPAFCRRYFQLARKRAGVSPERFSALARTMRRVIRSAPHEHGWLHRGHIAASALADPYIEMRTTIELVLTELNVFPSRADLEEELHQYFSMLTPSIRVVFKPETPALLTTLVEKGVPSYFVSNSQPHLVQERLAALAAKHPTAHPFLKRIHGHARKYAVEPDFADINREHLMMPGLKRPVHLRRPHYFAVLNQLRLEHKLEWHDVVVAGDIWELDLALPFTLGATVGLFKHHRVQPWERAFVLAHSPRARLLDSPLDVLSLLD